MVFDPISAVNAERNATRDFVDILQREQHALRQADVSLLLPLAQQKAQQAQKLAQLADARKHWLATRGHSQDTNGMKHGLNDFPGAADAWAELLQLAETASQLNRINGILVGQRLRYNQQAVAVLQATTQVSGLYGSDGHAQLIPRGRHLGQV